MPKPLRSCPGTTIAAAELFAELEGASRPRRALTFLESQWRKAEAQCRLEDAVREVVEVGQKRQAPQEGGK